MLQRSTNSRLARAGTALTQLQRRHGNRYIQHMVTTAQNRTGLPDDLKAGAEKLSGLALDDVQVHYNSAKPAQLKAVAYTQGSDIYIAPGQEAHLPHEAWHVIQQKQGKVRPTINLNGQMVNDEPVLEQEATDMGAKARQPSFLVQRQSGDNGRNLFLHQPTSTIQTGISENNPIQMKTIAHKYSPPQKGDGVWEHNTQFFTEPTTNAVLERAGEVEAIVHPPINVPKGWATASGYDPLGWYWVGQFVIGGQSSTGSKLSHQGWVRFHLLNAWLGGDGRNPAHLVPTRGPTNTGNPWRAFEDGAIAEVQHGNSIHFHVEVDYHPTPAGPAQPGDAHFKFFPMAIDAEYTPWDSFGNKWGQTETKSIPANQLNPPNRQANTQTHYLDGISVGELKDVLGIDEWLAARVANASDMLGRATTVQDVYDTLTTQVWLDKGSTKNPLSALNTNWPDLQYLLLQNTGHHLRISATCGAQDVAVTNSKLSNKMFQFLVKADLMRLAGKFKLPTAVLVHLDEMLTAKEKMTAEQLYIRLEGTCKQEHMLGAIDPKWGTWMKLLVQEDGPSLAFDPTPSFLTVTERVNALKQEKSKAIESTKNTKERFLTSLGYTPQDYALKGEQIITGFVKQLETIDIEPLTKPKSSGGFSLDDILWGMGSSAQVSSSSPAIYKLEKEALSQLEQTYLQIKRAGELAEMQRREVARQQAERERQEAEERRLAEERRRFQERQQAEERQRQEAEQQRLAEEQRRQSAAPHLKRKLDERERGAVPQREPGYREGWADAARRDWHSRYYDTASQEYRRGYDARLVENGRNDADYDFNHRRGRAMLGDASRVYEEAYDDEYSRRERFG